MQRAFCSGIAVAGLSAWSEDTSPKRWATSVLPTLPGPPSKSGSSEPGSLSDHSRVTSLSKPLPISPREGRAVNSFLNVKQKPKQ